VRELFVAIIAFIVICVSAQRLKINTSVMN